MSRTVRLSSRLTTSPACLVGEHQDLTPQMEQLLKAAGQEVPKVKRILELNADHAILVKLQALFEKDGEDPKLAQYAQLLHGQAILAEGGQLPDAAAFGELVATLMADALP